MRALLLLAALFAAGCSIDEERVATRTAPDPCAQPGPWSTGPEARWVRQIVEAGGYNVFSQTASALVATSERHEFYIWATESQGPLRPPWRRMATVRGIPIYGDRALWRAWQAQEFTFWVQGTGAPAAGRLAPVVDASLRIPFPKECRA